MKFSINRIWCVIISYLFSSFFVLAEQSEPYYRWKVWRQNPELQIQYRDREDGLIEINATFNATSTLSGFLLFIQDLNSIENWVAQSEKSEYLENISSNEFIFKTYFSPLWPIKKRILIVHSRHQQIEDGAIKITLEDASNSYPDNNKDTVTAKLIQGSWKIKALNENELSGQYNLVINPMGDIPLWLAKQASLSSMWQTLINLQTLLPDSKWQKIKVPNIQEWQPIQLTSQ